MPAHLEKRCFLERRAYPMSKKHHFGPPADLYIRSFSFFTKKKRVFGTYFACFSHTNCEIGACDLYRKIRPKTRFFVKNENDPMYKSGGGPKWCFLDIGDAHRSANTIAKPGTSVQSRIWSVSSSLSILDYFIILRFSFFGGEAKRFF